MLKKKEQQNYGLILRAFLKLGFIFTLLIGFFLSFILSAHFDSEEFIVIKNPEYNELNFRMFENIPDKFYEGIDEISFNKDQSFYNTFIDFSKNKNYQLNLGYYSDYKLGTWIEIINTDEQSNEQVELSFYHEIGHNVYYNILTEKQRLKWKKIYEDTFPKNFITRYASTNPQEDFAENFAYFIYHKSSYLKCYKDKNFCTINFKQLTPERIAFMIEEVMKDAD